MSEASHVPALHAVQPRVPVPSFCAPTSDASSLDSEVHSQTPSLEEVHLVPGLIPNPEVRPASSMHGTVATDSGSMDSVSRLVRLQFPAHAAAVAAVAARGAAGRDTGLGGTGTTLTRPRARPRPAPREAPAGSGAVRASTRRRGCRGRRAPPRETLSRPSRTAAVVCRPGRGEL